MHEQKSVSASWQKSPTVIQTAAGEGLTRSVRVPVCACMCYGMSRARDSAHIYTDLCDPRAASTALRGKATPCGTLLAYQVCICK